MKTIKFTLIDSEGQTIEFTTSGSEYWDMRSLAKQKGRIINEELIRYAEE